MKRLTSDLPFVCFPRSLALFLLLGAASSAQTITEFPIPGGFPTKIVTGSDGNLWFINVTSGPETIGRMSTAGAVVQFPIEEGDIAFPRDLATGPDGNVWFVQADLDGGHSSVSRMTPSGGVTRFPIVPDGSDPIGITSGFDGNLWITLLNGSIGRVTVGGEVTLFPTQNPRGVPNGITAGPDGNVWYTTGELGGRIGRITPTGVVTEFPIPTAGSGSYDIAAGSDGNLWFTETNANRIGRITPSGAVTEFPIPALARDLIAAPDGNIWFAYAEANRIGRITTAGTVLTDLTISSPFPASGLTVGPDRSVWFTQPQSAKIGRIALTPEPAIAARILPVVGSTAGVGGSYFRTSIQLHNGSASTSAGRFVFHRSGISGSSSDPALSYTLAPNQTQSIADLLPAMGFFGIGSATVEVTTGSVPLVTARVFNDAGAAGTTGFTEELMRTEEALPPGVPGVLLLPADLTRFRFNFGVRTLDAGATATLTLRDAAGGIIATVSRAFPATYHEQQSAAAFLGVTALPVGGSVTVAMTSGTAIFYGATVDNITGDPSLQIARAAP